MAPRQPTPRTGPSLAALALFAHGGCAHRAADATPTQDMNTTAPAARLVRCQDPTWDRCEAQALAVLRSADDRVQAAWWAVARELDRDRAARDVIAVHCREERLARLTALRRLVELHGERLRTRLAARDGDGVARTLALLREAARRAEDARDESRQCIGGGVAAVTTVDPRRQV